MIKTLLIEDELPARKKILRYIKELDLDITVIAEIESVRTGLEFFETNSDIDLIISDIELRDGNVFSVFGKSWIPCPIIFTTAYNEFWMEAFETNGIAYLIKPFSKEKFKNAWEKFIRITGNSERNLAFLDRLKLLITNYELAEKTYKTRINIPTLKGSNFLELEDILYFSADQGLVFAISQNGKKSLLKEGTLKEIEDFVNPILFFRINRSQLIHKKYVEGTERHSKNNLEIKLRGKNELLICSQRQISTFLEWMET